MRALGAFLLLGTIALVNAKAEVLLTFEGIGDRSLVADFYNGGTGGNHWISFVNALTSDSSTPNAVSNFANNPSGTGVIYFTAGTGDIMNTPGGFSGSFSFYYSAPVLGGVVTVWDGVDGTGRLLDTFDLTSNSGCEAAPVATYRCWSQITRTFAGVAQSVNFSGTANMIAFDDIRLTTDPLSFAQGSAVPEPGTMGIALGAFAMLALVRQRRR